MGKKASSRKARQLASAKRAAALAPWAPEDVEGWAAWEVNTCARCVGYFGGHCKVLLGARARGASANWVRDSSGPTCLQFKDRATYLSKRQRMNRKEVQLDLF